MDGVILNDVEIPIDWLLQLVIKEQEKYE